MMDKNNNNQIKETILTLKKHVEKTFNSSIVKNPDFKFGAVFSPQFSEYNNPLLVSTTDSIGSKIKFSILADKHDTIGIDLVAVSINNILSTGAKPLFLSNYIGINKIEKEIVESLIKGVVLGCQKADCVLIGGETKEIPDLYLPGDYDFVSFAVGLVEKSKLINPSKIEKGDLVLGFVSSGFHISGYAMLKTIMENNNFNINDRFPHTTNSFKDITLKPTRIYSEQIQKILEKINIHALKQITKGLHCDIKEIIPEKFDLEFFDFEMHEIFKTIMEIGKLNEKEMYNIFNCGIGMIVVISEKDFDEIELLVGEKMKIIAKVK